MADLWGVYFRWSISFIPRPFEEEKGPDTHCLRTLHYPKNFRGSDTILLSILALWPLFLVLLRVENGRLRRIDFRAKLRGSLLPCWLVMDLDLKQRWLAFSACYCKGQEIIPYSLPMLDCFTIIHVARICVRKFYGCSCRKLDACANSVYQALSPQRAWGRG